MDPVTINKTRAWLLHVERSDGSPVEDAQIAVEGPQVTENRGNGDYLLEGMRFSMAGAWEIDLTIDAGGQTDVVRFAFELK